MDRTVWTVETRMNWRTMASANAKHWLEAVQHGRATPGPTPSEEEELGTAITLPAETCCTNWRTIRDWLSENDIRPTAMVGVYQFTRTPVRIDRELIAMKFFFENVGEAFFLKIMFGEH